MKDLLERIEVCQGLRIEEYVDTERLLRDMLDIANSQMATISRLEMFDGIAQRAMIVKMRDLLIDIVAAGVIDRHTFTKAHGLVEESGNLLYGDR